MIVELERMARQEPGLSHASCETVRRMFTKRSQTLAPVDVVQRRPDRGVQASHV
jgi:hypothetical protein